MRVRKPGRRYRFIGLTSLIDVIFLLLLFFMLTSTFVRYSEFDLTVAAPAPEDGGSGMGRAVPTEAQNAPVLSVRVRGDGWVHVNGRWMELARLSGVIAAFQEDGGEEAVLIPEGAVAVQQMVSVLEQLRQTSLKTVSLGE
ncbi:ExbD/TolR family protein [Sneathiella chinensis]|uniref:Biopolymer transporter ExbD n=1 Tax=Sneathiella chinensis TaxID=349750 RepID=A0ABQ5U4N0_9PROT|nr:biopolymer transporter ExbD [Sneathiella chinensis]GLQ06869.1 hypothetical protein GCM10007924_20900 [Sneathiella chinensis]